LGKGAKIRGKREDLRVLIYELGDVVDLVVNDAVKVLLGVVLGNILVGELLSGGHLDFSRCVRTGIFLRDERGQLSVSEIRARRGPSRRALGSNWMNVRTRIFGGSRAQRSVASGRRRREC
jgi:hypothetical protein